MIKIKIIIIFFFIGLLIIDFLNFFFFIRNFLFLINFSPYIKQILQIIKICKFKKIKIKNNIFFIFKNFKKILKYVNLRLILPIIFCLLFADSFSIATTESENNIHHYVLKDNGELIEITNDEEKIKMEKEKILKELKQKRMEEEDEKLKVLLVLVLLVFFFCTGVIIFVYFYPDDDSDDDKNSAEEKRKDFEKDPQSEPYLTPYLKRWKGQEERLKDKTNPFYTGTCVGIKYNHFSPEYVDKYNEFIREWEDDHIYKSGRYWRKNKK